MTSRRLKIIIYGRTVLCTYHTWCTYLFILVNHMVVQYNIDHVNYHKKKGIGSIINTKHNKLRYQYKKVTL
jgi:hypothetical protein